MSEEKTTSEGLEQFELHRTRGRSVTFRGEEIAGAGGKWRNGKEQNRWTDLTLYRTKGGKYILHREYFTQWQGEENNSLVTVCEDAPSVIAALKDSAEIRGYLEAPADQPVDDEGLGDLESELLRRARNADPAFGDKAVEEVE